MSSAVRIPTELVNYLCELAAGNTRTWYPFFCPRTGKLSWRLNTHAKAFRRYGRRLVKTVRAMHAVKSVVQCVHHETRQMLFECPIYYTIYPKYYYYTPYFVSKFHVGDSEYNIDINIHNQFDSLPYYTIMRSYYENKHRYVYCNRNVCYEIIDMYVHLDRVELIVNRV